MTLIVASVTKTLDVLSTLPERVGEWRVEM